MHNSGLLRDLLDDHREDGLRSGEGSAIELKDGALLLFYTYFHEGGTDASPGAIVQRISSDGGETWSERETRFSTPPDAQNCMSVSLARLADGRIGCLFVTKWNHLRCLPTWSVSDDEGKSWSEPEPVTDSGYLVVNNDRLVVLRDGTIAFPYAYHPPFETDDVTKDFNPAWNADCGIFYSRDHGKTWHRSSHTIKHTPEVYRPPLFYREELFDQTTRFIQENRLGVFQEPGLVQLSDGRLMMYMRSLHGVYRCFAKAVDAPWLECDVIEGFHVCCGPQTIKPMPNGNRLVMLYNDKGTAPIATPEFNRRTPLSIAFSDDNGKRWHRWGRLEDESTTYCYFSLLFFRDRFLITYYEGAPFQRPDGRPSWRPLASLKRCTGEISLFERERSPLEI